MGATLLLVSGGRGLAVGGPAKPTAAQSTAAQSATMVLPSSWWGPEAALADLDPNLSAADPTAPDILENLLLDECDLSSELEPSDDCMPASMRIDQGQAPSHPCVEDDSCHELIFEDDLEKLEDVQLVSPVPSAPWLDPCWYDEECKAPA